MGIRRLFVAGVGLVGALGAAVSGCGGSVGGSAKGDAGTVDGAPASVIGEVLAQQFAGSPAEQDFGANLAEPGSFGTYGTCAGEARTVGDCCYLPPSPSSGISLHPFDGGNPVVHFNAGVITLVDTTSKAQIGTLNYADGYPGIAYPAPVWAPGDILTVSATGDQISAFTVSAPALIPPIGQIPSHIDPAQDFQITWQPDPNADIMNIGIIGTSGDPPVDDIVDCTLPDANGSVMVAAGLFAAFRPDDVIAVSLGRVAQRDAKTSAGTVLFATRAYSASVQVPVQSGVQDASPSSSGSGD